MRKYIVSFGLALILLTQMASAQTAADQEFFINIVVTPEVIDGEDEKDPLFYVLTTDILGSPMVVSRDLEINLVSSNSTVAGVPGSVTIQKGEYFAVGNVERRGAGFAEIKASYQGDRVSDGITIVETSRLTEELYLGVRTPTDAMLTGTSMPISIYLSDSEGEPIEAPFEIGLVADYDQRLIDLEMPGSIETGSAYAVGTISSLQQSGNAWIRLRADDIGRQISTSVKVVADKPFSLVAQALPEHVSIFDRSFYVYVGLMDEDGLPTVAAEQITVNLYSNMTRDLVDQEVFEESLTIDIDKGKFGSFINVPMDVSNSADEVLYSVTAATEGLIPSTTYLNLTSSVTRFVPDSPAELYIEALASVGENSELISVVQLRDENGTLYSPVGKVDTEAMSSNIESLVVEGVGSFGGGQTYTPINLMTGFKSDEVILVGAVDGIGSANQTITVISKQPSETVIFSPASKMMFDNDNESDLFVVLLDDLERVVKAESAVQFLLTPINSVSNVMSGGSYAQFSFGGTEFPQNANITLAAIPVGVESDEELESELTIEQASDSGAVVQLLPAFSDVVGSIADQSVMIAQLLDASGNPVRAASNMVVSLASTDPDIIGVDEEVIMPKGSSYGFFSVYPGGAEGTATITASASNFEPSSVSLRSVIAPIPLSITTPVDSPQTNKELVLTVHSEPGTKLSWTLPDAARVITADGEVGTDGTAEAVLVPLEDDELIVAVEGSREGYLTSTVTYVDDVRNLVQNMNLELISYSDLILPGTASQIEVLLTDESGTPIAAAELFWEIGNAEVLSMSEETDFNGRGSIDIKATDEKNDVVIGVVAAKDGFLSATGSSSFATSESATAAEEGEAADTGEEQRQQEGLSEDIPSSYMYMAVIGAVVAVASMRVMSMRKGGGKNIQDGSPLQHEQHQEYSDNKPEEERQ